MNNAAPEIQIGQHKTAPFDIDKTRTYTPFYNSNEFSYLFAQNAHHLILHMSVLPVYKFDYISPSSTHITGYTPEEFYADPTLIEKHIHPEDFNILSGMYKRKASGNIRPVEVRWRHKDGRTIWTESLVSPILDKDGSLAGFNVIARDITERKHMEEALRESEARLQEHKKIIDNILATMPEGVLVIDDQENIVLANKSFYKIFHLNSRSLKNRALAHIFPEKQFFDLRNAVKSSEPGKKSLEFRYQAQGHEIIIDCVILKMDRGCTLLSFTDISRDREEEEKLYLTDRLASIGEMAAGLAHEINNPLTSILALSQVLLRGNLTSENKEDIECIKAEAQRAAAIVKNVLLFARNKTGENSQCSVNKVVKDVLKLREFEERISDITIVTNLEENLPPLPVDQGQLQQVFLNLVSNSEAAIKEVDRPGIITIATQRVNNHVNIIFSDNGCGINKQTMPRIFDPFFTTKEIGKGTGLGLSICFSIIVKHGGKISAKSRVNEGTTFTIRMPIIQ